MKTGRRSKPRRGEIGGNLYVEFDAVRDCYLVMEELTKGASPAVRSTKPLGPGAQQLIEVLLDERLTASSRATRVLAEGRFPSKAALAA